MINPRSERTFYLLCLVVLLFVLLYLYGMSAEGMGILVTSSALLWRLGVIISQKA